MKTYVKQKGDGKVTATGAGTTSIICTNVDTGLTAYCIVTVTQPVTGITLNSDYQELWVGAKYAIIPSIEPIDAENKKVTYLSSDTSVATVDENGNVVAKGMGSSKITATTTDGSKKSDSFTVYVKTDAPTYVNVHYYDGYIRLSWNENSEASSYEILRANSPTEEFKNVGSTKGTSMMTRAQNMAKHITIKQHVYRQVEINVSLRILCQRE